MTANCFNDAIIRTEFGELCLLEIPRGATIRLQLIVLKSANDARSDAAVVRDHAIRNATYGFQPINGVACVLPMDNY